MASLATELKWNDKLNMTATIRGHELLMDANEKSGGDNKGPSPKEVVLAGLAGCSAMDVIMILSKMRQPLSKCDVKVSTGLTEGQPSVFDQVVMEFHIGSEAPLTKVQQAVELSMSKYCGVGAMITKTTDINYIIFLNNERLLKGKAKF